MKNVNRIVSPEIRNQIIFDLKTKYMQRMVLIYANFQAVSSLQNRIKPGLILSFLASFNGMFASNHNYNPIEKEMKPETHLTSNGKYKISFLNYSPTSNPINTYKVPFTLQHNLIMIKAIVDGKEGLLLLDTGMDKLILNQNHFRGKTTSDYISGVIDDMGNSHRKYVSVQIGNLPKHTQHAFISDLDHLEQPSKWIFWVFVG